MNKQQRKEIADAFEALDYDVENIVSFETKEAREGYAKEIEDLKDSLQSVMNDEQEKYDNMPESLQAGSKGDTMQEGIDDLEAAIGLLEEAADAVRDNYPDKPTTEDVGAWAAEVQQKIEEARDTAPSA